MQKEKGLESMPKREGEAQIPDVTKQLREAVAKFSPKSNALKWAALALFAILAVFLFRQILDSNFSAMEKALASVLLFMISGEMMRGWMNWDGFYGLIMFKDRSTLGWIERQAILHKDIWVVLADVGLVMGYGLFSLKLMDWKKRGAKYMVLLYALGIPLLFIFSYFLTPAALPAITGMLSGGDLQSASAQIRQSVSSVNAMPVSIGGQTVLVPIIGIALAAVLVLFGLAGSVLFSLIAYAVLILPPIAAKVWFGALSLITGAKYAEVNVPPPGGSPILPGVNLPLVEGVLALASLLVVHEMSHGFLACIARVRLDSAGIVFFGVLPFGAFVEPDENEMAAKSADEVNRIMVAGSAANIIAAILAFFLLTSLVYLTADYRLEGWKVVSGPLPKGAIVYSIGGINYSAQNISLSANSSVEIMTSMGNFTRVTDAKGKVGISLAHVDKSGRGFVYQYKAGFEWIEFILDTLALAFATNVLVAVMNLLPLPLFDGNRLMANGVKNEKIAFAIGALAAGALVVNLLPWVFR